MPPLNSLKCVGERGKDESFSSQRRAPAKGARGRATRLLGSPRAGRKREGFLRRRPRRCFASRLFGKAVCRSPGGEMPGLANAACLAAGMRG